MMQNYFAEHVNPEMEQRRNPTVSEKGDFIIELSIWPYVVVHHLQSASSAESIA